MRRETDGPGAGVAAGAEMASGPRPGGSGPGRWERARLAVRERLPLWVQLRCATDPKALAALALVLVVAVVIAVQHFWAAGPEPVRAPAAERAVSVPSRQSGLSSSGTPSAGPAASASSGADGGSGKRLVIDVEGKVRHPGIHRLPAGSRVTDALDAAGGVLHGASTQGLNRARLLADGEQIVVGGAGAGVGAGGGGAAAEAAANGPPSEAGASGGGPGAPGQPVSLGTATEQQLDTLPGVGPVLARHIIEFRTRHGGFRSVDQLREVTGIGERRFADLRPLVQP
ncbi:ComEA family DNA-binding protein [Streptomyces pinistramenti]|uniref:ComEA family DNA-binding protein n=1 Tax=Streptomyces pinistramenti TaxID=2884812 RepID=UPI001D081255|nr:ComEA family DNA-binding protein [Streptomyces pinistramenti]MCB5906770.1 ComEA family DNA-binding protein [Streptomyces pinistramenti]